MPAKDIGGLVGGNTTWEAPAMRRRRIVWWPVVLSGCALLLSVEAFALDPLNVRMQKVVAQFVEQTGYSLLGVGSWIPGTTFNAATSDFDMRLIVNGKNMPTQHLLQWQQARGKLAALIEKEFGDQAGSILSRTNLYAPNQLMEGVKDAEEALARFQKLNTLPNLSYRGPVTPSTPLKWAEGLYGAGAPTYVQGYEKAAGRLFYNNGGKCVTGLSELAHMGEAAAPYTAAGTASTAGQWVEHCVAELNAGRGAKVAKYLERLEQDLIKSRSLSGLPLDADYRQRLLDMRKLLKASPEQLAEKAAEVSALLARGKAEAALLSNFANAGPMRQAYLRVVLDGMALKSKLGDLFGQAMAKCPSWVDAENMASFITFYIGTGAASESLGRGDDVFQAMSNVSGALNPFKMIGPALLAEIMSEIITQARLNGYDMAAGFQGAWDLVEGIYTAWGRAAVDPDPRRKLTLADLVAKYQDEQKLEAWVVSQAIRASTRGLGTANEQADQGVADAIFAQCWPTIRDAWRWERDGLTSEYLKLGSEVVHTPLVVYYKPGEPQAGQQVVCEAVSADQKLGNRLERMRQIFRILYGPGSGIATNYYWTPNGESVDERGWHRAYAFAEPGTYPVKVRFEMAPYTGHPKTEPRVMLRREVPALVDVVVAGKKPTGGESPAVMALAWKEETYTTNSGTVLRTLTIVLKVPDGFRTGADTYRVKVRGVDVWGKPIDGDWDGVQADFVEKLGASNPKAGTVVVEVWHHGGNEYAKLTW